jgi:hypothetical protein
MAAPKRVAPRRTAAAIAEDLAQARKVGGIWRTGEGDLAATLDFLALAGVVSDEEPLRRARDLLVSYVRRGCQRHEKQYRHDKTARAAASSLETLLLRPDTDTRLVGPIRRDALRAARHSVSADAVRHHEDKIINEIAQEVFADLQNRRTDEPQSVEAAIHRLVPMVADLRQQLHDGLCLTFLDVPPADPYERRMIEGFYRQTVIKLGDLLLASIQLAKLGLKTPNLTPDEQWFVQHARHINAFLFEESDDRHFMLDFIIGDDSQDWQESIDNLLATGRGKELYDRWVEWARSCYPTCAFERSTELARMCSPHAFVTLLYDIEVEYVQLGFSELNIEGNIPLLHHSLDRRGIQDRTHR